MTTLHSTRAKYLQNFFSFIEEELYQGARNIIDITPEQFKMDILHKLGEAKTRERRQHIAENKLCPERREEDHRQGRASMEYIDPWLPTSIQSCDCGQCGDVTRANSTSILNIINMSLAIIHEELDKIYQKNPPHPDFWY